MPITRPEQIDREVQRQWWQLEADLYLFMRLLDGKVLYRELLDGADMEGIPKSRILAAQYRVGIESYGVAGKPAWWGLRENGEERHPLENERCSSCSEPMEPYFAPTGHCMHCDRMASE
jgi:hypothetical protein